MVYKIAGCQSYFRLVFKGVLHAGMCILFALLLVCLVALNQVVSSS